jgi:hypothetical protein
MDILFEDSKDTFTESGSGVGSLENPDTKLYPTHHVAVSPNGQHVATFDTGIYSFFFFLFRNFFFF